MVTPRLSNSALRAPAAHRSSPEWPCSMRIVQVLLNLRRMFLRHYRQYLVSGSFSVRSPSTTLQRVLESNSLQRIGAQVLATDACSRIPLCQAAAAAVQMVACWDPFPASLDAFRYRVDGFPSSTLLQDCHLQPIASRLDGFL